MEITEYKVRLWNDQRLRALVTVVFNECFVVRNIKVIEGREGKLFVAMPSRQLPDRTYVDIAHPITKGFRRYLEDTIIAAYLKERDEHDQDPATYREGKHASGHPVDGRDHEEGDFEEEDGSWAPRH